MNRNIKQSLLTGIVLASAAISTGAVAATDCSAIAEWDAGTAYNGGAQVQQNNQLYQANWWTQGNSPADHSGEYQEWSLVDSCGSSGTGGEPGNQAPQVALTSPEDNSSALEGDVISLTATASDNDGTVSKVDFYLDNVLHASDDTSPYQVGWTAVIGSYTVKAIATDNEGATTASGQHAITVTAEPVESDCGTTPAWVSGTAYAAGDVVANVDQQFECKVAGWCSSTSDWAYEPGVGAHWSDAWDLVGSCQLSAAPVVTITAPADNSTLLAGSDVVISATASDADGTVTSVEFFADDVSLALDTEAPYSAQWVAAGNPDAQLKAVATDDSGETSQATVLVTVSDDIVVSTLTAPASGATVSLGSSVTLSATASSFAGDITSVEFLVNGQSVGTDTTAPYSVDWSAAAVGDYTITAKATDDQANSDVSAGVMITVAEVTQPSGKLPKRTLVGYWHNFDNGSGYIRLEDVSPAWDVINLSFAENKRDGLEGEVAFELCPIGCTNVETEAEFKAAIKAAQAAGKIVNISLGGANAHISLDTAEARDNFIRTMGDIIETYGLNGLDIDLEGGSMNMTAGDNVTVPKTPAIVYMIEAVQTLKARFGDDFILTMAPETAYVQGGDQNFGGIWGAYLPLIDGLRDDLDLLHVQHYNTGSLTGTDGVIYQPGTVDFHVALTDMMITGFYAGTDTNPANYFAGLRDDQMAFGLPSGSSSASSGFTTIQAAQDAVSCLVSLTNCGNYVPAQASPNFRGLMTWSINWDQFDGYNFSVPHRAFLDTLD